MKASIGFVLWEDGLSYEQVSILMQIGAREPGWQILLETMMNSSYVAEGNFNFIYFKWDVPDDSSPLGL